MHCFIDCLIWLLHPTVLAGNGMFFENMLNVDLKLDV